MPRLSMPNAGDAPSTPRPVAQAPAAPEPEAQEAEVVQEEAAPAPVAKQKKSAGKRGRPSSEALTLTNTATPVSQIGGISGDVGGGDLNVPGLVLVQPDSSLTHEFGQEIAGHFVYAKEASLGTDLRVVVVSAAKKFQEDKPFDPNNLPRSFDTIDDARQQGVFNLNEMAILDLLIAVESDSEDSALGSAEADGVTFIPCRWYVTGRAYRSVFSNLLTALGLKRDRVTYARFFSIQAKLAPARGRTLYQAFLKATDDLLTNDQLGVARSLGAE